MSYLKLAAIASISVGASGVFSDPIPEEQMRGLFSAYIHHYQKVYPTEDVMRIYGTFRANVYSIMAHNASGKTWRQSINYFADLTAAEFLELVRVEPPQVSAKLKEHVPDKDAWFDKRKPLGDMPVIDWVAAGKVQPVKNCVKCPKGSWAFTAASAIETTYAIRHGKLLDLSVQELIDCSRPYHNEGCSGGDVLNAYSYTTQEGIATGADYDYTGVDTAPCQAATIPRAMNTTNAVRLPVKEEALFAAGEMSAVSLYVDPTALQFYASGIIDERCANVTRAVHPVTLVGFNVNEHHSTLKNVWGEGWGEKGYFRVSHRSNAVCHLMRMSIPWV